MRTNMHTLRVAALMAILVLSGAYAMADGGEEAESCCAKATDCKEVDNGVLGCKDAKECKQTGYGVCCTNTCPPFNE